MIQPDIETPRLILRPFVNSDAARVQVLASDNQVSKSTLHIPYPYLDGMAEQWIASHKGHWDNKTAVTYAIIDKEKLILMGTMSLVDIRQKKAELGYWLGVDFWRKSFCSEAAQALVDFALSDLGIDKIFAEHLIDNPASGKVMEKIGMLYQHKIQKIDRFGQRVDVKCYQLLKTINYPE